jgi:hypothetical protein
MDNGLLKSPDGGNTYIPVFPSKGYHPEINGHVWRVITPAPGKIVATSSPWNAPVNQVVYSGDNGVNFTRTREGLPASRPKKNTMWGEGYPRALAADPKDPGRIYLGIDGDDGGGLFVSQDGGKKWKRSPGQPACRRIYNGLAVDPTNSERLYWGGFGWRGGVYVSEDRGLTWRHAFHRMKNIYDLTVAPDGTVYAAGDDRGPCVYKASPGGVNWKLLRRFPGEGSAESVAVDPEDPSRLVVAVVRWSGLSGGKLYGLLHSGWHDLTGDLPEGPGPAALAFHPENGYLYLISYAGSVYRTQFRELRLLDDPS